MVEDYDNALGFPLKSRFAASESKCRIHDVVSLPQSNAEEKPTTKYSNSDVKNKVKNALLAKLNDELQRLGLRQRSQMPWSSFGSQHFPYELQGWPDIKKQSTDKMSKVDIRMLLQAIPSLHLISQECRSININVPNAFISFKIHL